MEPEPCLAPANTLELDLEEMRRERLPVSSLPAPEFPGPGCGCYQKKGAMGGGVVRLHRKGRFGIFLAMSSLCEGFLSLPPK